jgi:hypothetical protein
VDPTLDGRYKHLEERDSPHLLSDACGSGPRLALFPLARSRSYAKPGRAEADTANATGTRAMRRRMRRLRDRSGVYEFE